MKLRIWLSFDLGIRGDYEGLYAWLDDHGAKECGESLATLMFEYEKNLPDELAEELKSAIELDRKSRFYVIWKEDGKMKGRFVVGKRRASPWQGLGASGDGEDEADVEF